MDHSQQYGSDGKYTMDELDGAGDSSSAATAGKVGDDELPSGVLREQDRFLPIANVARIMKRAVPSNGKIAKEARECLQECVSEFISFITGEASDRCHQEKRKTINGEDILFAMSVLGFDNYVDPLKLFLQRYREWVKGDRLPENFDVTESNQLIVTPNELNPIQSSAQSSSGTTDANILYTSYANYS